MRHSTFNKSTYFLLGAGLLFTIPCISQGLSDIDENVQSPEMETVITKVDEKIGLLSFTYSMSSKSYQALCMNLEFDEEAIGFISVFLSFESDGEFFYLPNKDEDARKLKKEDMFFSYIIDSGGMIEVSIYNPKGGSPWSTLESDNLTVRLYHTTTDISPYQDQGLDLENEHVFNILTEGYMDNKLTVW